MLRQQIMNQLDKANIDQKRLAKIAKVNESTISRYLNNHDELKFDSALRIIHYLFPERELDFVVEYALTQKHQNARYCLEYCMINRLWDTTEQIIATLYSSGNLIDREWAKIYELELARVQKKMEHEQLLEELRRFYPNTIEVQIMHTFVVGYIYFEQNKHQLLYEYLDDIQNSIKKVKSTFIQESFTVRQALAKIYYYFYKNKIEIVRDCCLLLINQEIAQNVKAIAFHHLGHSYLFEDYERARMYVQQAINLFKASNRLESAHAAAFTLSFIQSYWKIERSFPFELNSIQEKTEYIYYLIQKGETQKAKGILDQIDSEALTDWNKPFHYFYLGVINNDKNAFYQSVRWFRKTENLFHVQLPIQELRQMNEDEDLLQIFAE